ncbi:MAG: SMC-Scp complex subunit ScpB [Thermoplasmata archaeon]|nr:SMC-Scp complex subunit ScpB [Thermoplasmata archaeon]
MNKRREEVKRIIEAALFAAGRPLSLGELQKITGVTKRSVEVFLESLEEEYKERDTALQVGRFGNKAYMRVKPEYSNLVASLAPQEVPKGALKTLALIAYHQPVPQSKLVSLLGTKVYDHVKLLKEMGLISWEPFGATKLLKTTERFADYFGIERGEKEKIRRYLMKRLKIDQKGEPIGEGEMG